MTGACAAPSGHHFASGSSRRLLHFHNFALPQTSCRRFLRSRDCVPILNLLLELQVVRRAGVRWRLLHLNKGFTPETCIVSALPI